jgi:hypothetical protein
MFDFERMKSKKLQFEVKYHYYSGWI